MPETTPLLRLPACPNCGAATFMYGDLLPGETKSLPGEYDPTTMRRHRACTLCIWSTELKEHTP